MNATPSAAGQLRALVVDDQEPMREIIRHLLRDIGIRHVATAESGRKALELLLDRTREFPDIILCDLHMDDMSGTELIHKMRRAKTIRNRDVPVIVVTGEEDKMLLDVAAQVGANAVMQKPLAVRDLAKKIAAIVGYEVAPA
jgi:two-component system chemotaxis response regulator CheY